MEKEKIQCKLDAVLNCLGMETTGWPKTILLFRKKLELLYGKGRYNKLFKALFASNDLSEFNSYTFEVLFSHDFESRFQPLEYEVKQLPDENSSVDFFYKSDLVKIYFELKYVQQRDKINRLIRRQLANSGASEILLDGEDEAVETARLQNSILRKCQNEDGRPIKFHKLGDGSLNFIVINLSELHLGMIDKGDCVLTMGGDRSVPQEYHRNIFGMWEDLHQNSTEKKYHEKFQYFRETIHGVMFVKYVGGIVCLENTYIDRELEYFTILNKTLLSQRTCDLVIKELSSFLRSWTVPDNIELGG